MAYKFIKTTDDNNKFDTVNVTLEISHNEVSLDELEETFICFLKACGFFLPPGHDEETWVLAPQNSEEVE